MTWHRKQKLQVVNVRTNGEKSEKPIRLSRDVLMST